MDERELIKAFRYDGYDISNYESKIQVVESDNSAFINGIDKQVIATIRTFSCANILFYSDNFAYLVHMFPSETVGKNDKFLTRIEEVKRHILNSNTNKVNVLISLGVSEDYEKKINFHDLSYINAKLDILIDFCNENNIELNMLPTLKSKFLLFDLINKLLIVNNKEKKPIDIKNLERFSNELTTNKRIK